MPAVVFDFDGVIVDSEPMHERALRAAVRELGMDFTPEQYWTRYLGFDDRDTYAAIARDNGRILSQEETAHLSRLKWAKVQDAIASGEAASFPGSLELLRSAVATCPTAVCSGARRLEIDLILTRLGVRDLIKVLVSADDVPRSKPDPGPYLETVRRLAIPASECIAIEDTPKGIRSAVDAGLRVVGVCHSMKAEQLSAAHRVVPSIADLRLSDLLAMVPP